MESGSGGDRDRSACIWTGWGIGSLLLVYFGFPALWVWPLAQIWPTAHSASPPDWVLWLVTPIGWLMQRVPAYKEWVEWGLKLLGIE